jgi:hypothetical protein
VTALTFAEFVDAEFEFAPWEVEEGDTAETLDGMCPRSAFKQDALERMQELFEPYLAAGMTLGQAVATYRRDHPEVEAAISKRWREQYVRADERVRKAGRQ